MMSQTKYLFDRVKKTANKAIRAERSGDLTAAFELFLKAAELLNQLIAMEKTSKIRDSYYVKAKEYIKRAKEIKILISGPPDDIAKDLPSTPKKSSTPSPPKDKPPLPPPPSEKKHTPLPPPPKDKTTTPPPPPPPKEKIIPPPPTDDMTAKMMRGEDGSQDQQKKADDIPSPPSTSKPKPPPQEKIDLPTKTTYELLLDEGNHRDCIKECAHSVEAELRVRMGMFDEQLTLGMLIDKGVAKGLEVLKDFKFVNIILNRIEHENYRPSRKDAENAVFITTKILMS